MKYTHIFIIALAFIAFSDSSAFAQNMEKDAVSSAEPDQTKAALPAAGKKTSAKNSGTKHKSKPPNGNPEDSETIVFPKVSKVGKPSDDWETNTGRRGSGNRQTFR